MKDRHKTIVNYAEHVVDGMDLKDLCNFAIDCIVQEMDDYTDDEIVEVVSQYDHAREIGLIV